MWPFCPCVLCVTTMGLYVPDVMRRRRLFQTWKISRRFLAFPLAPQVHTPQYQDLSGYCWIRLIWISLIVPKICCGHWRNSCWVVPELFLWLFLVKFPIYTQTSVLSHHGQLGVAFAFPPPLFLVLLRALHSLMYGGLLSTGPTCYLSFHYSI